jgi:hypothetical protein
MVCFLVPGHEHFLDGKAALLCDYSDDDDQNYITETAARKRLKVCEGPDGKVTLTFAWTFECQSEDRKFNIVPDSQIDRDVRFGMKYLEECQNSLIDDGDVEAISERRALGTSHVDCLSDARGLSGV